MAATKQRSHNRGGNMTNQKARLCKSVKADGRRCAANAMTGSVFCFFHDPTKGNERQAARRNGGIERSRQIAVLPPETPDREIRKVPDVAELLVETVNLVRRGQLDPKVANSIANLAGIIIKALQIGTLEGRITSLEAILKNRPPQLGPLLGPGASNRSFSFEGQQREELNDEQH
jgi:hypothetical protein